MRFWMRGKIFLLAAGALLSSPTYGQSYNGFATQPEYDFSTSNMSWAYGADPSYSAARVLARLRDLCGSTKRYDQYYCKRGMKVLNKAYAEYKLRMAAKAAAVE